MLFKISLSQQKHGRDKRLQGMVINTVMAQIGSERMSETMEVFISVSASCSGH